MTGEPILVPMLRHTVTRLFLALVLCSYQFGIAQNSSRGRDTRQHLTGHSYRDCANVEWDCAIAQLRSHDSEYWGGFKRSWDSVALASENNVVRFGPSPSDSLAEQPSTPASAPALSQDVVTTNEVMALVTAIASPALLKPESVEPRYLLSVACRTCAERRKNRR